MKKSTIGLIIGVMSVAIISLVGLQVELIRQNLAENRKQFENDVDKALGEVREKLLQVLILNDPNYNGYFLRNQRPTQGEATTQTVKGVGVARPVLSDTAFSDVVENLKIQKLEDLRYLPIEEAIPLKDLHELIYTEFRSLGIRSEIEYGIFSYEHQSFVILNGIYQIPEAAPDEQAIEGFESIYNSGDTISLFNQYSYEPKGRLVVYFPNRNSDVWRSLGLNLLATFLLAILILLCFSYTIVVILRQKKVSEMKTDFINNMTHEFKTPIATISLAADSIISPRILSDPDKVSRFTGIIKQENKRMNSQVEKVLQMARIDRQEFDLKLTEVDLHEIICSAIENIRLQVEPRDGTVATDFEADQPIIEGDATHISNVVNNLLDNANKYSPGSPEITVQTQNIKGGVQLSVTDKGIGMSKESRKHIFDKFYRVHTGNLHDVKGFGLGLSYVKAIMTAHNGSVDVKSELGKGSSFILFFPYRIK